VTYPSLVSEAQGGGHGGPDRPARNDANVVIDLIGAGKIHPVASKIYPLQDIAIAPAGFQVKRYRDKRVLIP